MLRRPGWLLAGVCLAGLVVALFVSGLSGGGDRTGSLSGGTRPAFHDPRSTDHGSSCPPTQVFYSGGLNAQDGACRALTDYPLTRPAEAYAARTALDACPPGRAEVLAVTANVISGGCR